MLMRMCMPHCLYGWQRTISESWFSPFIIWVPGIELVVRFDNKHLYLGSHLFGSAIINVTSVVQDVLLCARKERKSSRSFSNKR